MSSVRLAILAAALVTASGAHAQVTSYPGSACQGGEDRQGKADVVPTGEGAARVVGGLGGQQYELVCPLVTGEGDVTAGVRVYLRSFYHNACSVKTVAAGGRVVLTSAASVQIPSYAHPYGPIPIEEERELFVPHRSRAARGDARVLVCRLPHVNGDLQGNTVYPRLRSYSVEPGPIALSLADLVVRVRDLFAVEVRDEAWALESEQSLRSAAQAVGDAIALESAECRSSFCRVGLAATNVEALDAYESAASAGGSGARELLRVAEPRDGAPGLDATLFVAREGMELPRED